MPLPKPDKALQPEDVAQVNADLTAAHAEHAAEAAAAAERELAEVTKEDPKARLCPNCNGEMIQHGDATPIKAGAWHCNACGSCWAPGLKHLRYP